MLRLVDLSQDIYDGAPTFEPDPKTHIRAHLTIADLNYNMTEIVMSAHYGTHLDAPYHFFDDGRTVENLDVRKGFGLAHVLDFTHKKARQPIDVADFAPYQHLATPGSRLIFNTGWDKILPDPDYFGGQPYLTVELTTWLVKQSVACVALDTPTTYPAEYTASHHSLLNVAAEVLIIEGLRGLDRLTGSQVILIALPLRIRGRDGSPCRAMAIDGDISLLMPLIEQLDFSQSY
jgi:arylformamidase